MTASPALQDVVQLVYRMYSSTANEVRSSCTETLMTLVARLPSADVLQLGLQLLQVPEASFGVYAAPMQAYGATVLMQAVCSGALSPESVGPEALLSWLASGVIASPLLRHSLTNLITAVAVRLWPENWSSLLPTLCPENQVFTPHLSHLLQQFCEACVEPPVGGIVPHQRMRQLKQAIRGDAAATICKRLINSMFAWYQQQHLESVKVGLGILSTLSSVLSVPKMWELGFDEVFRSLVKEPAYAREACFFAGCLLSNDVALKSEQQQKQQHQKLPQTSGISALDEQKLYAFAGELLEQVVVFIAANDWETVQELLDIAATLPLVVLQSVSKAVASFVAVVVQVPSVLFAITALDIFNRAIAPSEVREHIVDPGAMVAALQRLASKNIVHPTFVNMPPKTAITSLARTLSESQFATVEAFEVGYAELRGHMATTLARLAASFQEETAQFCSVLVRSLPCCRYADDPVTAFGHVQQHSHTFCEWQSAQYLLEQLVPHCLGGSSAVPHSAVLQLLQQLEFIPPLTDAVLVPVLLNMLTTVWSASAAWPASTQRSMWVWSITLIEGYMQLRCGSSCEGVREDRAVPTSDPDLLSARKRAFTVFVHAAIHHGEVIVRIPELNLLERCQGRLVSGNCLISEKAFVYEAVASLSNHMSTEEQPVFLEKIIGSLRERVLAVRTDQLAPMLCATSRELQDERAMFRDAVGVLASVLRRCKPSPYMTALVMTLVPTLGNLVLSIHSIRSADLPGPFASLMCLSAVDKNQFLTGTARKSDANQQTDVSRARTVLQQLRLYLYQALGSLGHFVALESFASALAQTTQHCASFEIHTMRAFSENALFEWMKVSPACASFVLPSLSAFFDAQSAKTRSTQDEVVDSKQLFYFTKDVLGVVGQLVEVSGWTSVPGLEPQVVALLCALVRSGFEPRAAANSVTKILEEQRSHNLSDASAAELFACLATSASSARYTERDKDFLSGALAGLYAQRLALYSAALSRLGVSEKLLSELSTSLSIAPRFDVKRKVFREFLCKVSGNL